LHSLKSICDIKYNRTGHYKGVALILLWFFAVNHYDFNQLNHDFAFVLAEKEYAHDIPSY